MRDKLLDALALLDGEREQLQSLYDVLEKTAEEARRSCVPVQQRLSKIKDAITNLKQAIEWKLQGGAW